MIANPSALKISSGIVISTTLPVFLKLIWSFSTGKRDFKISDILSSSESRDFFTSTS